MSQLSDDCFAFGDALMPLDQALALLSERVVAVITDNETTPVAAALGRVLAEDVVAALAVPPHANSAVDGYAVYFDDLVAGAETSLKITGRIAAGHPLTRPARRGEALRVFTGAPMPAGASDDGPDSVLMQEDCREQDGRVVIPPGIERGANRRRAGEDIAAGSRVLAAGRRLRAEDLGLAASVGRSALSVRRRLRVALISTGDEIREPGQPLDAGAVYDSNRFILHGLLAGLGAEISDRGIVPDQPAAVRAALLGAIKDHDLIVTSGGVSAGEEDHVRAALEALGSITFWRLAIKPGRPVALGQVAAGARRVPVVGLPGNPVAVVVTFLLFVRPLILRLAGAEVPDLPRFRLRAGFAHDKKAGRREYLRARIETAGDGGPVAVKSGRQGAGILSSVATADGLVELPEQMTYLKQGMMVDFLPFADRG